MSSEEGVPNKVGTDDNLADALTKGVDASAITKHAEGVRMEFKVDRHDLAPGLENDVSVEDKMDSKT